MSAKIKIISTILFISMAILTGCISEEEDVFGSSSRAELRFENVQANHQKPSKVQFIFSLRDRGEHAVLIPQTEFDNNVNIIIEEDDDPIDYTESHGFVHTAESFGMDLVLVLDYTASMAENSGIDTMLSGVNLILASLAESHRTAIVEFHDNASGDNYSVLQDFTSDKQEAWSVISDFIDVYNGFSTCWDAVYEGLELFVVDSTSNTFRALVFLSDGFDNSSQKQPNDLIHKADSIGVAIYNIGIGETINPENEDRLEEISYETGGKYHRANNLGELQDRFIDIVDDLGGNYKISYITPKRGEFEVKIWLEYDNKRTELPIIQTVDGSALLDSDRRGIISFNQPVRHGDKADIFIFADHVPREVGSFRFHIDLPDPVSLSQPITVIDPADGGLLDNSWSNLALDQDGFYVTSGADLNFGDFGVLFKISLQDLPENSLALPIIFDNSIYSNDVMFYGGNLSEINVDGNWETSIMIE